MTELEYTAYFDEVDGEVWTVVNDHHFEGTYPFEDFQDALEFTYEIGDAYYNNPWRTSYYYPVGVKLVKNCAPQSIVYYYGVRPTVSTTHSLTS